ncbi:hypothetical protein SUGI_0214940 [Cryptomeria japonica]|nr:hypothetical protein SUGI_0214940 [Cryptomeria japonica]
MDDFTYKSGYHSFFINDENYLALIYRSSTVSIIYWPSHWLNAFQNGRTTYNVSRIAFLDRLGRFNSSDGFHFNASDFGEGPKTKRRLTMDVDGHLRLYSFDPQYRIWNITWMAVAEHCRVHDYYGSDNSGYGDGKSLEECRKSCLDDCDCLGFGYRLTGTGQCFLKFLLVNGYQSPGVINDMHVKISINDSSAIRVPSMSSSSLYCSNQTQPAQDNNSFTVPRRKREELIVPLASFASTIGFVEIVCMALGWWILFRNFDRTEKVYFS